jgi:transcriptional regulator with XRE-family HTH domain
MEDSFWSRLDYLTDKIIPRKDLAEKVGISVKTISSWRPRRNYPTADVAARIARELRTSVEYMVFGEDSSFSLASAIADRPALRSLVERLAPLGDEDIIKATRILDAAIFENIRETQGPPATVRASGE